MSERAHTPPGLPAVGSVHRLARDPLRYLVGVQNAYGGQYPLVRLEPAAGQSVTVVTDPGLVHEVLADRERFRRPDAGGEQRRNGLLSSEGPLWERQRDVLDPEFVGPQLAGYAEVAGETVADLLAGWPAEGLVDLFEETSVLTTRVITQSLFSRDVSRERALRIQDALDVLSRQFEPSVLDFLAPDALQPGPGAALDRANDALDEVAEEFVAWHRAQDDPPRDMLTALLGAVADPETALAEDELVDETVLFMTAGQETTALTLTYAFHWLSEHPEARERVRAEARSVLDGDRPTWADLSELTYTERVVRETLRLTPAAWNISREPRGAVTLAGARLDAEDLLMLSPYAHHRDRRAWTDPEEFRPERWGDTATRGQDSYFPFGSGPRVCIGRQVALTEAQFALAGILQDYEVETTGELSLQPAVTLRPADPVEARVRRLA